ncbi:MAG: hypothetical protein ACXWXU_06230 [Solirubrobacterales bacterium]
MAAAVLVWDLRDDSSGGSAAPEAADKVFHIELQGTGAKALAVNPGPVPTEQRQIAGYDEAGGEMMPRTIEAEQVVDEALRAFNRDSRSLVPGRFFRNFMRMKRHPEGHPESRPRSRPGPPPCPGRSVGRPASGSLSEVPNEVPN